MALGKGRGDLEQGRGSCSQDVLLRVKKRKRQKDKEAIVRHQKENPSQGCCGNQETGLLTQAWEEEEEGHLLDLKQVLNGG